MVRKQIYLDERQEALLKERARLYRTTESELIRRAIDRALDDPGGFVNDEAWARFRAYAARRAELKVEPRARDWRREDLYDD